MNQQIPEFLIELSKQMNENDNRCTAHPFWQVRQNEYIVTEEGYNVHHWEIIEEEDLECLYHSKKSECFSELAEHLLDSSGGWCELWLARHDDEIELNRHNFINHFVDSFNPDWEELPDGYRKIHFQEVEKVLTTHLTQEDAEWFINRKKHDYPNAYTYVESAYWSPQLKDLQDWIKGLTNDKYRRQY